MRTNDIFRKVIQSLAMDTRGIQGLYAMADIEFGDREIANLLKMDSEAGFEPMPDYVLHLFLNSLIDTQRGKKAESSEPVNKHHKISNNDVLKKLRIAFNLHEQDVRDVFQLATIELTKSDLSALFRKPGHSHFKACYD